MLKAAPRPWTTSRILSSGTFGIATIVWLFMMHSFARECLQAFRHGDQTRASLWALQVLLAALGQATAGLLSSLATWDLELSNFVDFRDVLWVYAYVVFPGYFALQRYTNQSASQTYFFLYLLNCNLSSMFASGLSRMLIGWAVVTPLYVHWDLHQWRSDPSPLAGELQGWPLATAAVLRGAGLAVAGLASILLIQLACGPAFLLSFPDPETSKHAAAPAAGACTAASASRTGDGVVRSSARGVGEHPSQQYLRQSSSNADASASPGASMPPKPSLLTPPYFRWASRIDDRAAGTTDSPLSVGETSPPNTGAGRRPLLLRTLSGLSVTCAALDHRFYTLASRAPRRLPGGVLALGLCLPYCVYVLCVTVYQIMMVGEQHPDAKFTATQMLLTLVAACVLGRTDIQGLFRRLSEAEEVLQDLVPRHVAQALMAAASAAGARATPYRTTLSPQPTPPQQPTPRRISTSGGPPTRSDAGPPAGMPFVSVTGADQRVPSYGAFTVAAAAPSLAAKQPGQEVQEAQNILAAGRSLRGFALGSFDEAAAVAGQQQQQQQQQQGPSSPAPAAAGPHIAEWHEGVSILFADIRGFTEMAQQVEPYEVMTFLNRLYYRFDTLACSMRGIYKVETIGDCYMVASGLLEPDPDHAVTMLRFAAAMLAASREVLLPHTLEPVQIRIGIHSGRVMSGVVGSIRKRYCLFGDTVNTASRLETTSMPGHIHISNYTYRLAISSPALVADPDADSDQPAPEFAFTAREPIHVKGKGVMQTYFVTPLTREEGSLQEEEEEEQQQQEQEQEQQQEQAGRKEGCSG